MKKYILTSDYFTGSVTFGFNSDNWLVYFNNEAEFTEDRQYQWLFEVERFPIRLEQIPYLAKKVKGELKEVPADLSFDTFWNTYSKKINLKRVKLIWSKLNDADRMHAIINIKPYDSYLQRTCIGKAHPENYLRKEYFNVDWKKEK